LVQGKALADRYEIPFMEVSAKTGYNIEELFLMMGNKIAK
jgi:hypothetical protein